MSQKPFIAALLVLLLIVIAIVALQIPQSERHSGDVIRVAASFYPLYFLAQKIGGEKAVVMNITPAGAEPHDYEPTGRDIAALDTSDLLVLNGGGLEAWSDNILQNIDVGKTYVVKAAEGLATAQIQEEGKAIIDPHVWLSPPLLKQMVDAVQQGFAAADPVNAEYYLANATLLKTNLDELDREYRDGLTACAQKNIVTSHSAFGYLANAYGLNQISITGLSPDAEPSSQDLARIAELARTNNIKYIFFESLVSPKLAETIASEIGAQTLVLNPLEGLTNADIANGKNYFTEMRTNLKNLKTALQCTS